MKRKSIFILSAAVIAILFSGCNKSIDVSAQNVVVTEAEEMAYGEIMTPTAEITQLEDGFSTVRFQGNDGFQAFLDKGGASSNKEVIEYSTVEAEIDSYVDSIINPTSGTIRADSIGQLIMEKDKVDVNKTKIICKCDVNKDKCVCF